MKLKKNDGYYKMHVFRYLLTVHPKLLPVICQVCVWAPVQGGGGKGAKCQAMMKRPKSGKLPGQMAAPAACPAPRPIEFTLEGIPSQLSTPVVCGKPSRNKRQQERQPQAAVIPS